MSIRISSKLYYMIETLVPERWESNQSLYGELKVLSWNHRSFGMDLC